DGTRAQVPAPGEAWPRIATRFEDGEVIRGQVVGVGLAGTVAVDVVSSLMQKAAHLLDSSGLGAAEQNPGRADGGHASLLYPSHYTFRTSVREDRMTATPGKVRRHSERRSLCVQYKGSVQRLLHRPRSDACSAMSSH